jgi:transglutaminase-like putative cysteine protease
MLSQQQQQPQQKWRRNEDDDLSYWKVSSLLFVTSTSDSGDDELSHLPSSHEDAEGVKFEENDNDTDHLDMLLYPCRSNSTHIVWYTTTNNSNHDDDQTDLVTDMTCTWQTIHNAKIDAYRYLRQNVMSFDIPFLETMGFHDNSDNNDDNNNNSSNNNDGLTNGMIGPVIDLAFTSKVNFLYTDVVPQSIFYEYILNYANVNESRNNIRPYIYEYLIQPLFFPNAFSSTSNYTMADAIRLINANMWCMLAPSKHTDCIRFVSGQTPLIFDPMSLLTFGYGSCTGISILLVQALRTAGIPARLAGTPAWNQNVQHGNHNWVEIWFPPSQISTRITGIHLNPTMYWSLRNASTDTTVLDRSTGSTMIDEDYGGVWLFMEASPSMGSVDRIDDDWNPCAHFLCDADRQINQTQYFAARLDPNRTSTSMNTYFPLAWDVQNQAVPAVNRTLFYHTICAQCRK